MVLVSRNSACSCVLEVGRKPSTRAEKETGMSWRLDSDRADKICSLERTRKRLDLQN